MKDKIFLFWSAVMFTLGYFLGFIQQRLARISGHESINGPGVCLNIDTCNEYMWRKDCEEWLDM